MLCALCGVGALGFVTNLIHFLPMLVVVVFVNTLWLTLVMLNNAYIVMSCKGILICLMQVQGIAIILCVSDARNEVRLSLALSFGGQDHRRSLGMSISLSSFIRRVCKSALYYLDSDL